jgi:excisionase family DNA binding protein
MLLTVTELASQLHIKPSTLYAWAAQGKIPALKIHGLLRFRREAIDQWVASFEQTASPRPSRPLRQRQYHELDSLIAAAKRAVYTPSCGKTRPKSRPIGKEETDGAV